MHATIAQTCRRGGMVGRLEESALSGFEAGQQLRHVLTYIVGSLSILQIYTSSSSPETM